MLGQDEGEEAARQGQIGLGALAPEIDGLLRFCALSASLTST